MTDCSKKKRRDAGWRCWMLGILILCIAAGIGAFSGKKAGAVSSTIETTPIGTSVKVMIPDTLGDKDDDSMRVKITNHYFEEAANAFYYLHVDFKFTSLGNRGRTRWTSHAVFYDQSGKVLNREQDGVLGTAQNEVANLNDTFSCRVSISTSLINDVAAIVFQEHWVNPTTLPADADLLRINPWDNVNVIVPSTIGCRTDDTMRMKITDYSFQSSSSGKSYYLNLVTEFTSLGNKGTVWSSAVVFWDKLGNMVEGGANGTYGGFRTTGNFALGKTYRFQIEIPAHLVDTVTRITFIEHWDTNPSTPAPGTARMAQSITASNAKKTLASTSFKLKPGGKFYTSLKFTSSNKKVATVTSKGSYGVVKMKKPGSVKITITAPQTVYYYSATKTITLKVVPANPKLKVVVRGGVMTVSWGKVKGAAKYKVTVIQHGLKKNILEPTKKTKLSNTITKNKKYTIQVQAVDSTGKFSSGVAKKTVKT